MSDDTHGLDRYAARGEDALQAMAEKWDRDHPDGESDTVKWVSITDNDGTLCQFLLFLRDGEVERVGLARKRKGQPPNPYDRDGAAGVTDWYADGADQVPGAMIDRSRHIRTGRTDTDRHPGTPLTVGVHLIADESGDHRWQFPGFKVRGSVLARVLFGMWSKGYRQVPVALVRMSAKRYGS